eukprot:gene36551-49249_t
MRSGRSPWSRTGPSDPPPRGREAVLEQDARRSNTGRQDIRASVPKPVPFAPMEDWRLVSFDTTSRGSNLALIDWVDRYLSDQGVASRRIASKEGDKANLLATVGPMTEGGVVLSGHTDVVPVDGQPWTSDPFVLTERDGRLYGRGSSDMKGFIALALAAVPLFRDGLKRPVHLAFSYDEEVGCFGAPDMIAVIARDLPRPALCIVGEPSLMKAVGGHKGAAFFRVIVSGREAHSSQTHLGVSANMAAAELISALSALADELAAKADPASPFEPKGTSLTIGRIDGGTAANILANPQHNLLL